MSGRGERFSRSTLATRTWSGSRQLPAHTHGKRLDDWIAAFADDLGRVTQGVSAPAPTDPCETVSCYMILVIDHQE